MYITGPYMYYQEPSIIHDVSQCRKLVPLTNVLFFINTETIFPRKKDILRQPPQLVVILENLLFKCSHIELNYNTMNLLLYFHVDGTLSSLWP